MKTAPSGIRRPKDLPISADHSTLLLALSEDTTHGDVVKLCIEHPQDPTCGYLLSSLWLYK